MSIDFGRLFNLCIYKLGLITEVSFYPHRISREQGEKLIAFFSERSYFFDYLGPEGVLVTDIKRFVLFLYYFRAEFATMFPGHDFSEVTGEWRGRMYDALDSFMIVSGDKRLDTAMNGLLGKIGTDTLFNGIKEYQTMFKAFGSRPSWFQKLRYGKEVDSVIEHLAKFGVRPSDMFLSIHDFLDKLFI